MLGLPDLGDALGDIRQRRAALGPKVEFGVTPLNPNVHTAFHLAREWAKRAAAHDATFLRILRETIWDNPQHRLDKFKHYLLPFESETDKAGGRDAVVYKRLGKKSAAKKARSDQQFVQMRRGRAGYAALLNGKGASARLLSLSLEDLAALLSADQPSAATEQGLASASEAEQLRRQSAAAVRKLVAQLDADQPVPGLESSPDSQRFLKRVVGFLRTHSLLGQRLDLGASVVHTAGSKLAPDKLV